ncbi:RUN and FYVE domain-containing protein 2 isoform X2 [Culex quinquefasciatus]|uniref:RUN and FYVE domain-containing protein 2 isoform X2 n=1 Tax=Culex quinquefasciatus TaxID=7176 RepID=UPI0018E30D45|nr:RUN and FYVE domain-containing protein 2 isoform X2 [Culex quinquefasciatus]
MRALGIAQPNNHHQTAGGSGGEGGTSSGPSSLSGVMAPGGGPKIIDAGTITLPKPILGGNGGGTSGGSLGGNGASSMPPGSSSSVPKVATAAPPTGHDSSAQDTIYLCNFRVSVDGEWLCLKELNDLDLKEGSSGHGLGYNAGNGGGGAGGGNSGSSGDARDPASIERSNLVNICKLVVKELLEQSIRFGRMLDSDHLPLQHFFIVLEHVLRHGLRPKKGLLGPKKELWDILQSVERYCVEAQDITSSVRDLPTVRTHMGRARAWLRLALMQKKLADYLQILIERRDDTLAEYYEPHALMMSDEVIVIIGILVGLNVIDCNLCVKEEDLDSQQGVIDFSLYLRSSSRNSPDDEHNNGGGNGTVSAIEGTATGAMTAVLDQKNYIEELNRHLNATVGNLQAKVEGLTTTNALMKEDLAIARNSLLALQAENAALRRASQHGQPLEDKANVLDRFDPEMAEALAEERKKRQDIEKELDLQVSLKAETEMAMKLLEKDIHEKQDTIVSLRRQLEDIKSINLDMYRKLQECEASLKHKAELMAKMETQRESMANAIAQLEKKYNSETASLNALQETSQTLSLQVVSCEQRATRAEADLRIEREWRAAMQDNEVKHKEQISQLQLENRQMVDETKQMSRTKADLDKLRKQWEEDQRTLEELGIQLSVSKLQIADLKERAQQHHNQTTSGGGDSKGDSGSNGGSWTPDKGVSNCKGCEKEFSITRRKHHCRHCGAIFCSSCSEHTAVILGESGGKPVRVCDVCWQRLASSSVLPTVGK